MNVLILGASSFVLASCILIGDTIRSELLILVAASVFGGLGTWVHIRRSSRCVGLVHGLMFGLLIGLFGWLFAGLVQMTILLLMGKPQIAFAPNSLMFFTIGLAVLSLFSGLAGIASSFLWSRAHAYSRRAE